MFIFLVWREKWGFSLYVMFLVWMCEPQLGCPGYDRAWSVIDVTTGVSVAMVGLRITSLAIWHMDLTVKTLLKYKERKKFIIDCKSTANVGRRWVLYLWPSVWWSGSHSGCHVSCLAVVVLEFVLWLGHIRVLMVPGVAWLWYGLGYGWCKKLVSVLSPGCLTPSYDGVTWSVTWKQCGRKQMCLILCNGGTKKSYEKQWSGKLVCGPDFEPRRIIVSLKPASCEGRLLSTQLWYLINCWFIIWPW
jgi:hypothetical protein